MRNLFLKQCLNAIINFLLHMSMQGSISGDTKFFGLGLTQISNHSARSNINGELSFIRVSLKIEGQYVREQPRADIFCFHAIELMVQP